MRYLFMAFHYPKPEYRDDLLRAMHRFGTALHNWREAVGFAPGQRMQWTYTLSDRSSLGMGMENSRDLEDQRQLSLYGRYSLTQDWALSAESLSRDPSGLLRLQDFRIGVQRRF